MVVTKYEYSSPLPLPWPPFSFFALNTDWNSKWPKGMTFCA